MHGDPLASDRVVESIDDLTPDELARLGRAMARLLMSAWRASEATDDQQVVQTRTNDDRR